MEQNEKESSNHSRQVFLLTCSKGGQPIRLEDFKDFGTWRIRHRQSKIGDEVYLLNPFKDSRGIVGRGVIISTPYHPSNEDDAELPLGWAYLRSGVDKEKHRWVIDVRIDEIIDPSNKLFLTLAELSLIHPPANLWHRQPNGMRIPENVAEAIRNSKQWKTAITPKLGIEPEEPSVTSYKAWVETRRGQQQFREKQLQHWRECSVTGCSFQEVLIASHIVPWFEATDTERLDVFNGLLLTPNLDKLFDSYFISFNARGKILVSKTIGSKAMHDLGINPSMKLRRTDEKLLSYLQKHESAFLEKEQAR